MEQPVSGLARVQFLRCDLALNDLRLNDLRLNDLRNASQHTVHLLIVQLEPPSGRTPRLDQPRLHSGESRRVEEALQELATAIWPPGNCPRSSGEYIASTRVGGRVKRPTPFSRTV